MAADAFDPFGLLADRVQGLSDVDQRAYDDLSFYSQHVMGRYSGFVPNSELIDDIYHTFQYTNEDMLVVGPRQSAKSTALTINATTYSVGHNRLLRVLLAFATQDLQGKPFMRQIHQIFESNEDYIRIMGRMKPDRPIKWTEDEIIVDRVEPPGGMKDATIGVVGLGSKVPSKRADLVICDDLVNRDNAYSAVMRRSVVDFVFLTLFPILDPRSGRRIIVGSRWDPNDLYAEIARRWGLEFPKLPMVNLDQVFEPFLAKYNVDHVNAVDSGDAALQIVRDGLEDLESGLHEYSVT